jgi:hypothetical protein
MDSEALKQILTAINSLHEAPRLKPETVVAVFAALVAAAAAVVTYVNGQRQLKSTRELNRMNLTTPLREKWIDELRSRIATVMFGASLQYFDVANDVDHRSQAITLQEIVLMLNPNDKLQSELELALVALSEESRKKEKDGARIGPFMQAVTAKARELLKREWQDAEFAKDTSIR